MITTGKKIKRCGIYQVFHSEAGLFQTITAWWLTALEQPKDRSRRKKETEDPLLSLQGPSKVRYSRHLLPNLALGILN